MNNICLKVLSILLVFSLLLPSGDAKAQSTSASGPVYIVQEGDRLRDIAYRFHVSLQDLANANGIVNPNLITVGQPLVIPGLEGIQGLLTTEQVPFGETLHSLSLRYHLPINTLERLNHITSPNELYAGFSLVILQNDNLPSVGKRSTLGVDQSLLELSILNNTDPWTILDDNQLKRSSTLLPGDVLRVPGEDDAGPGALPATIKSVSISGLTQGQTAEIQIDGISGLALQGSMMDHTLNFS